MTPTDKLEMQEDADGSATVTLPDDGKQEQQIEAIEASAEESTRQSEAPESHSRSMSDSEREKLREARRLERQNKKQVQRKKLEENAHIISALKRQNDELATRLANVENRT